MAQERHNKRTIIANSSEPKTGDFAFTYYEKVHPVTGNKADIDAVRNELRGLRGHEVLMTIHGARISDSGETRRFTSRRTFTLNRYTDLFGSGSAYTSAIRGAIERNSDDTLVTYNITIEDLS